MPASPLAYTYTTQAEIERMFSVQGVIFRGDDDLDGAIETGVMTDIINYATEEVNFYLSDRYSEQQLDSSHWVRWSATIIACHHLCQRRGNDSPFEALYDKRIELLEKIHLGEMHIPGLPVLSMSAPVLSNLVVNNNHATRKLRVQRPTSTGNSYPGQQVNTPFPDTAR